MFTFSGDDLSVEIAGASSDFAKAAGEAFASNVSNVSSASMEASNNLPAMVDSGLGIA